MTSSFAQDTVVAALKKYYGFSSFRPYQQEIIEHILEGKDCLAVLPTGGGKSLCFQLPGLLLPGTTIVVSPLISLMTDQVAQLQNRGISAIAITSMLTNFEREIIVQNIRLNRYTFIYVSPEKLATPSFRKCCSCLSISLLVIDEAHCISEWGHQFRPQYLEIHSFVKSLPRRPILAAFTASATPDTAKDICTQLHLGSPRFFRQSVYRSNLSLHVVPCPSKTIQHIVMRRILHRYANQPIIIYCATRIQTEDMAVLLNSAGSNAAAYHAGLESHHRQSIQMAFIKNSLNIICATTAFGMGVDKPNIRAIIHLTVPVSLEGYYQEVGRAGRDGKQSFCYLLALPGDDQLQAEIIGRSYPPLQSTQEILQFFSRKKTPLETTVSLKELARVLSEVRLESSLWLTLKRGEERKWWQVDWQQKTLKLENTPGALDAEWRRVNRQHLHQLQKLERMKQFCNSEHCRQHELIAYFEPARIHGQKYFRCRICDRCRNTFDLTPAPSELQYFKLLAKDVRQHGGKKPQPFLLDLCHQILASYQPQQSSEVEWMSAFGKGWQKEWGAIVDRLGTNLGQQNHVDDNSDVCQSKKSPPTL